MRSVLGVFRGDFAASPNISDTSFRFMIIACWHRKRRILLVTSLIVVVSSDTMTRIDEQLHERYSSCKKLRGGNLLLLLIVPHEHQGSVLD